MYPSIDVISDIFITSIMVYFRGTRCYYITVKSTDQYHLSPRVMSFIMNFNANVAIIVYKKHSHK